MEEERTDILLKKGLNPKDYDMKQMVEAFDIYIEECLTELLYSML